MDSSWGAEAARGAWTAGVVEVSSDGWRGMRDKARPMLLTGQALKGRAGQREIEQHRDRRSASWRLGSG